MENIRVKKTLGAICAVFVLALFLAPIEALSFERDMPPEYGMPEEHAAPVDFSEGEIQAFAQVQNEIIQIQQEYNTAIAEAGDEAQRQEIIQEANEEMIGAIEAEGISIEAYNEILTEAQANPELMQRIERAAQETLY